MQRKIISTFRILKEIVHESAQDRVLTHSAALAYYTIFALPGLLLLITGLCSLFFGREVVEGTIIHEIGRFVGMEVAAQIQQALKSTVLLGNSSFAAIIGVITLLIAATGIFGEIQDSINTFWGLMVKPHRNWVKMIINRLISFAMIVSLGFVLLVSLVVNTLLEIFLNRIKQDMPDDLLQYFFLADYLFVLMVIIFLFGFIFKALPDARIHWKDVLAGATFTGVFFFIGTKVLTNYMRYNINISFYGTAGSVIILLLWVYYSAIILYVGAEFTQVYTRLKGRKIEPNRYAMWVETDFLPRESNTEIGDPKVLDEKKLKQEIRKKHAGKRHS